MSELTFIGKNREVAGMNNLFMDTTVVDEDTDYLIYDAVPDSRKFACVIQFVVNNISENGFAEILSIE